MEFHDIDGHWFLGNKDGWFKEVENAEELDRLKLDPENAKQNWIRTDGSKDDYIMVRYELQIPIVDNPNLTYLYLIKTYWGDNVHRGYICDDWEEDCTPNPDNPMYENLEKMGVKAIECPDYGEGEIKQFENPLPIIG